MQKFEIHFSEEQLADLRQRLKDTRLPPDLANESWQFGTDKAYLQELENDDLVKRKQYNTIPPAVEYSLTESGKEMITALEPLYK